jgi:hypothetical protein
VSKRIAAGAVTAVMLMLGGAGTAAADINTAPGPGGCLGPPGQSGLIHVLVSLDMAPGQYISNCNGHGHGQNQNAGGGATAP